ncbi:MAG: hypothetical protein V4637_11215 [Pseudomonadota bacterium]
MSNSPWSTYGRTPARQEEAGMPDPLARVVSEVTRGRKQLRNCLDGALREYFEIHLGHNGYRRMIEDALTPSAEPESVEERLARLSRQAQARRSNTPSGRTT